MPATADPLYHRHRLSADDYERMGQAHFFGEDDRVELIDGEIIDMPPIGSLHGGAVNRIANRLVRAVSESDAIVAVLVDRLVCFAAINVVTKVSSRLTRDDLALDRRAQLQLRAAQIEAGLQV